MDRNNSYIYGSAAPKLPERDGSPQKQQRIERKVQKQTRPAPKFASIPKGKLFFAMIFITAVCFVILYRFTVITELNTQMGDLTKKYDRLRDENRMLNVDIQTSINLDYVKEIAETKLNMHKPDQYQLVLVNVPKSNYSVVLNHDYIDSTSQKTSIMEKLMNTVRAIIP